MKVISKTITKKFKNISISTFADLHIGDEHCVLDDIKAEIEEIRKDPKSFVILNGDLMNNATKSSVSDVYGEVLTPGQQLDLLVELFKPIKKKILAITSGNHERRTSKCCGIDLNKELAERLGLANLYTVEGALLFLNLVNVETSNKLTYSFYITHGSGGGRKAGGKVNRLADMSNTVDSDIYIHSHTHLPMAMRTTFFRVKLDDNEVENIDKLFINTSSKLTYGGYGEIGEYTPSATKCPKIYLDYDVKNFSASV